MATAARGHSLTIRVQQLESEIPSIERAFLSQTDHSSFFYHAGVDWHPNLRLDQNLVTQGDMPRFIMDSYEECRAPPRLFLLDKFDVAGAGACLKRYTDPSIFKVEPSEITGPDVQREKKIRKAKKKGPRWRNGETPEVLPTAHTKLHQLFLEERVENGVRNPSLRAKLKRRLNGFPFDSKTGKSYMEKLLKSPSPDHKVTVNPLPLMSDTNDHKESGFELFEVRPESPNGASEGRKRSPPSSLDGEEYTLNPSMYEPNEPPTDDKLCEVPYSYPSIATDGILATLDRVTGKEVVAADAESKREGSLTGYQSDDVASEMDNYEDAPSTMELEMDGDSELRVKSEISSSDMKNVSLISNADEEHLRTRSCDSQSAGGSTISDEENSSTKEMSSLSSESPSTSAEKPQAENFSAEGFQFADVPVNEIVDASSYQKTADKDLQVDHHSKPVVSDYACTGTDAVTNHRSEFEQLTSSLCSNGSIPTLEQSDSEEIVGKCMLKAPESDETVSTSDDEEKKTYLIIDTPGSPSLKGFDLQSGDDSPGSSAGEHLVDEPNGNSPPCLSAGPDIYHHTTDSSVKTSSDSQHEDESDHGKDQNLVVDIASTLYMPNVLSTNGTSESISSENLIPGKLEDEFSMVPENCSSDYPVRAHNEDNIESAVSKEDNLVHVLDDEDSNGSTDSPNHLPCIMEASPGNKLEETSLASALSVNVEDNHWNSCTDIRISSENLELSNLANSRDKLMEGLGGHGGHVIPEEETTNETLALETPEPRKVPGLQGFGISRHVSPNDSEALRSSWRTPEDLEGPSGTVDTVEMDGTSLWSNSSGQEVTEISASPDLKSMNKVHVLLDKSDSEADKSDSADMASAVPAVSDNASPNKLAEAHNNCFEDSSMDELENDKNCPSECHGEPDIVEKVGPAEASAVGFETTFCSMVNIDLPESEISGVSSIIPNSHLDSEVDRGLECLHAATIESPVDQCGMDREQELFNQSGLGNHIPDAPALPVDYNTKESTTQEKIGLPLSQLDQELPQPEISLELSPLLPMNHQQMPDHDDCKQDNDSASALSLVDCRSPSSFSELPRPINHEIDVPGYPKDPLDSIFPPSNPSETNQINLADLPPLPPLPPVEWRMGKLQHASSSTEGEMMRQKELLPHLIFPWTVPSNGVSSPPPTVPSDSVSSPPQTVPSNGISSPPPTTSTDDVGPFPQAASASDINSSLEEMKQIEVAPMTASKEENVENSCSGLEAHTLHDTIDLLPKIENKQPQIVMPNSENVLTLPAEEDRSENGSRAVKLPRPRNPLVDDVAVLDKSKLRKVTERIRPEIQKVEERDSLLEQIRTKSFNLKPAMASRPSIRGPNTNLKVAAILEKANAIRQAFADSDEDDSDSWSDS